MPRQARSALVALDILELLQARAGSPIGVTDASRHIGINKASTHTVLRMLASRGYAVQDPETRKFRRGPALWSLGVALSHAVDPIELAREELTPICASTNANASVSRHVGNGSINVVLHVGGAFDGHRMYRDETSVAFPTGVASVVLAWEDPATVRRIYEAWRPERRPQGPFATLSTYMQHLREIRRRGYLTGLANTPYPDVRICYTEAPSFNDEGEPVFVVSLTALTGSETPVQRFYPEEVLKVASKVMRGIGGQPPTAGEAGGLDQWSRSHAPVRAPAGSRSRPQAARDRRARSNAS